MDSEWLCEVDHELLKGWYFYDLIANTSCNKRIDLAVLKAWGLIHDEAQALLDSGMETEWRIVPAHNGGGKYNWIIYRFLNPDDELAFRLMWS